MDRPATPVFIPIAQCPCPPAAPKKIPFQILTMGLFELQFIALLALNCTYLRPIKDKKILHEVKLLASTTSRPPRFPWLLLMFYVSRRRSRPPPGKSTPNALYFPLAKGKRTIKILLNAFQGFPSSDLGLQMMTKYLHVINIGIQNNLTYRFNFLARTLFGLIPLIATLYVWRTIYEGKGPGSTVGDYSLVEMISYYLIVTIVDALTAVNEDDWQIATDIKDGNVSQFLLKPIDYLTYRLCLFFSGRLTYIAMAAVPLALFILYLHNYFVLPKNWTALGFFLVSTTLTALLQFFMSYTMAMLAFWVLEVSTFIFILFAFEYIASGHLFPLDILPRSIEQVLYYSPFPYQLFFPVSIYMGKTTGVELMRGFVIQGCWVFIAYVMARFAWGRGIRKYSAVGA
jgi:ABC-2 type transport system permease protein